MERTKYFKWLSTAIVFLLASTIYSQTNYKEQLYNSYISGNIIQWEVTLAEMEKQDYHKNFNGATTIIHHLYGYTGYLIGISDSDKAYKILNRGETLIDSLLNIYPNNATLNAYKGAFIGFRIGLSKFKAIYLGKESFDFIRKSNELAPNNIQALIEKGNALYYAPWFVGGDKEEALKSYQLAISKIEEQNKTAYNWQYLNILIHLGKHYQQEKEYKTALKFYNKILAMEPNFKWVRDELRPQLLQKM